MLILTAVSDEASRIDVRPGELGVTEGRCPVFGAYMMIDWSSKSTPATGKDSIWIGCGEWGEDGRLVEATHNPATRRRALELVRAQLAEWGADSRRVLVGFDFALGYPSGFARALGLEGPKWLATMTYMHRAVIDSDRNRSNRDEVARDCNRRIGGGGPGPFWGCHTGCGAAGEHLTTRRVGVFDYPYFGLDEFRWAERRAQQRTTTQSVWKLNQGVSVGGQTILGLHYVAELRFHSEPELSKRIRVWPFETGWGLPEDAGVVLAEIFPSLLEVDRRLALVPDEAQVLACVRHAAVLDSRGELAACFQRPQRVPASRLKAATDEEGWILFS